MRLKGALYVALALEALLRSFPREGGQLLLHGGLASRMLQSCMWNYLENDEKREIDSVIVLHLTVVARMVLADIHCLDGCFPMKDEIGNFVGFTPDNLVCITSPFGFVPSHFLILF